MRFRLATLLLFVLIAALGSLLLRNHLEQRPRRYETYTEEKLRSNLAEGRCAIVTLYGNWDVNTADSLRWLSHDVTRLIRRRNMVAMSADWTKKSPAVDGLMADIGIQAVPALAVYSPQKPDDPIIIPGIPSETAVVRAINVCCR